MNFLNFQIGQACSAITFLVISRVKMSNILVHLNTHPNLYKDCFGQIETAHACVADKN